MLNQNNQFNAGTAIRSRLEDAVKESGKSILEIKTDVADESFAVILKEFNARSISTELEFFTMMLELGGYSSIIKSVTGPRPKSECNEIGIETSSEYYIWLIKDELKDHIREMVQIKCAGLL